MTEKSYFWDGTTVGDATLAPISENVFHPEIWKTIHTRGANEGILYQFNELICAGAGGISVQVATGAALVNGSFYISDEILNFNIEVPSSNPRIDKIVLRRNRDAQTVRMLLKVGTEAASPSAPSLIQTSETYEIPIADIYINTSGEISITDRREFCDSPLVAKPGIVKLDEFEAASIYENVEFNDISQDYSHLQIIARIPERDLTTQGSIFYITLNNDPIDTNYQTQQLYTGAPVLFSINAFVPTTIKRNTILSQFSGAIAVSPENGSGHNILIQNYASPNFYKTIIQQYGIGKTTNAFVEKMMGKEFTIWKNVEPITRIVLSSIYTNNSFPAHFTLYGLR